MNDPLRLQRVLKTLASLCQTDLGARRAAELPFARDLLEAEGRLDRIGEATLLHDSGAAIPLCPRLEVADLLAHGQRGGVLDGLELAVISKLAGTTARLVRQPRAWPMQVQRLRSDVADLPDLGLLATLLADAIDDEGHILDSASPELARLRAEVLSIASRLRRRIGELVKETDEQGLLQDEYYTLRDDRYVLPVKSSDKRVLGGVIHGTSQTGQTVYVEPPEMVEGNNQLSLALESVRREERRILAELTGLVAGQSDDFLDAAERLAALDVVLAQARLAARLDAHRPRFSNDGRVFIDRGRHPLLVLDGVQVVANSVDVVPPARWLIVSGPNGGGKTVVLSTVGLAIEMSRLGLYVTTGPDTQIPWFDAVEVVLGDAQDVEAGLSTFEGHLRAVQRAARALDGAGNRNVLILLDELASGTEPIAGSALATALLEYLGNHPTPCVGLVTTHFEALKLLPVRDPVFENAALDLDSRSLAPNYRLRMGQIGSSNPLALAGRLGLPASVVERATRLAGGGGSEVAQTLQRLEDMRHQVQERLLEIEKQQHQLDRSRTALDDQRRNEAVAAERRIEKAAAGALAQVSAALRDLEDAKRAGREGDRKRIEDAARTLSARQVELERLERQAREVREGKPQRKPLDPQKTKVDSSVWLETLNRAVVVTEVDTRNRRYRVRAGSLEQWCGEADLRELAGTDKGGPQKPPPRPAPPTGIRPLPATARQVTPDAVDMLQATDDEDTQALRTSDRTVDLRGHRVDEALREVDRALDRATVTNAPGICVIHGMGTGAVREAVRQHLRKHPQVDRFRIGIRGEGGEGVTMVWIRQ